jgi:hypothetical protein
MTLLEWDDERVDVNSVSDLDQYLDAIEAKYRDKEHPTLAFLHNKNLVIGIGLGRDYSVLNCSSMDSSQASITSVGTGGGKEIIVFLMGGHWTEVYKRNTIPISDAREAIRHFLATGTRWEGIAWERD